MAKESFTDNKRVKELIRLMNENGLSEIELVEDKASIRIKRELTAPVSAAALVPQPAAPAVPTAGKSAESDEGLITIKSPMVGTFYSAANPESDPYVKVGSVVEKNSVVCIIEAMKVFNEIHAEVSGVVAKILVNNGQAVEFNQPLFQVRPQ
ncbi:MAG TPA: acetyl-CoA carboxylase biotin carboxyl carrier protein [Phycisphaerae bacterium]|nr:acetyl-CoA carboxylase biotin carboxyl carrier protein [Phycisphaerae bacterium]